MAITRFNYRNPWQELDQLTTRLGHAFGGDWPSPTAGGGWTPAVNVEERGDELVLTAEIPGMSRDDIEVELENNILTIRGEKSEERKEGDEERKYHLWERRYGSFQRSFTLPRTVHAEDIQAEYTDGILAIHMPKAPEAKSRRIRVGNGKEPSKVGVK